MQSFVHMLLKVLKPPLPEAVLMFPVYMTHCLLHQCRYTVSFMMPSKYDKNTLPTPNNADVKIREVPEQTFASFAWR